MTLTKLTILLTMFTNIKGDQKNKLLPHLKLKHMDFNPTPTFKINIKGFNHRNKEQLWTEILNIDPEIKKLYQQKNYPPPKIVHGTDKKPFAVMLLPQHVAIRLIGNSGKNVRGRKYTISRYAKNSNTRGLVVKGLQQELTDMEIMDALQFLHGESGDKIFANEIFLDGNTNTKTLIFHVPMDQVAFFVEPIKINGITYQVSPAHQFHKTPPATTRNNRDTATSSSSTTSSSNAINRSNAPISNPNSNNSNNKPGILKTANAAMVSKPSKTEPKSLLTNTLIHNNRFSPLTPMEESTEDEVFIPNPNTYNNGRRVKKGKRKNRTKISNKTDPMEVEYPLLCEYSSTSNSDATDATDDPPFPEETPKMNLTAADNIIHEQTTEFKTPTKKVDFTNTTFIPNDKTNTPPLITTSPEPKHPDHEKISSELMGNTPDQQINLPVNKSDDNENRPSETDIETLSHEHPNDQLPEEKKSDHPPEDLPQQSDLNMPLTIPEHNNWYYTTPAEPATDETVINDLSGEKIPHDRELQLLQTVDNMSQEILQEQQCDFHIHTETDTGQIELPIASGEQHNNDSNDNSDQLNIPSIDTNSDNTPTQIILETNKSAEQDEQIVSDDNDSIGDSEQLKIVHNATGSDTQIIPETSSSSSESSSFSVTDIIRRFPVPQPMETESNIKRRRTVSDSADDSDRGRPKTKKIPPRVKKRDTQSLGPNCDRQECPSISGHKLKRKIANKTSRLPYSSTSSQRNKSASPVRQRSPLTERKSSSQPNATLEDHPEHTKSNLNIPPALTVTTEEALRFQFGGFSLDITPQHKVQKSSDFAEKIKNGSEIHPKDLLEILFFENFDFHYFRDISDSVTKRQEYKYGILDQEKLTALLLFFYVTQDRNMIKTWPTQFKPLNQTIIDTWKHFCKQCRNPKFGQEGPKDLGKYIDTANDLIYPAQIDSDTLRSIARKVASKKKNNKNTKVGKNSPSHSQ